MGRLFLLFTLVPLVELYLLLQVGRVLGFFPTVLLIATTGVLGAVFAKAEGLRVFGEWQRALAQGKMPDEGILGGLLVLVGGVLLVTPGVLTDVLGLSLLIPFTRRRIAALVRARVEKKMADGSIRVVTFQGGPGPGPGPERHRPRGDVLQGRVVQDGDDEGDPPVRPAS